MLRIPNLTIHIIYPDSMLRMPDLPLIQIQVLQKSDSLLKSLLSALIKVYTLNENANNTSYPRNKQKSFSDTFQTNSIAYMRIYT